MIGIAEYKDKRVYAGYYMRYDGKLFYVISMAKDMDNGEDTIILQPFTYSNTQEYLTISKKSFCEVVVIEGTRRVKFKRQPQMAIHKSISKKLEDAGLRGPVRKKPAREMHEYAIRSYRTSSTYYEYAKDLCENYLIDIRKFNLCASQKLYLVLSRDEYEITKEDLRFLKGCLQTVLKPYKTFFSERFVKKMSIRKYAEAHNLNRGSVEHLQRKFFTEFAQALKARDETDGKNRLCITVDKY